MERFYDWAVVQEDSKGFTSVKCQHPVGMRDIFLTEVSSKSRLVCAAPKLVPHLPTDIYALEGEKVLIPCYNNAEPAASLTWYFQGQTIDQSDEV